MSECTILDEPLLEFRYGQRLADPRDGLSVFGPFDSDHSSHPASIVYGAIGSVGALDRVEDWSAEFVRPILTDPLEYDTRNWPHFPGFEAAYACHWPSSPAWTAVIDREKLIAASEDMDAHQRAARVVDMFVDPIETASKRDEDFDVLICVVPDQVYRNCRPESAVSDGHGIKPSKAEQRIRARTGHLFGSYDSDEYRRSPDFRRQLKARAMKHGIPIQIILESTLADWRRASPGLGTPSPKSAAAWFLSTALFYKAGGKPWRLSTAREGVCYVGLAFRRSVDPVTESDTACCAAQMFLDTGDGIVFKGEFGPWYSPKSHEFHLKPEAAEQLLAGVLETYRRLDGRPLTEIFLHSRSWIDATEFDGYRSACPKGTNLRGVRVRSERDGVKLFRCGRFPVQRGTALRVDERSGYLWSSGFKVRLETYDGFDVPVPLRIDVQYGDADWGQVAADILGLTKLNYNTCRLGGAQPVTVRFSDQVGEILVSNPTVEGAREQFKFYI